jgi:hypothetical protein
MFTVEDKEFGWDEIVLAAEAWGEWQPFFEQTRQTLACLRQAGQSGRLLGNEVKEAATAFRYAHNLISAQETQTWLSHWGLTVEEWMNCLRGQLLRERWAKQLDQLVAAHPVSDAEVTQVIKHYAVCADKLGTWAQQLAGRAALVATSGSLNAGGQAPRNLVAHIETAFQQQRQQAITPQLLAAKIADHRLDWIRFECRYVWFGEEQLAREAAFCVSEDGLTLDEVAYDARGIVQQWRFYLDELDAAARSYFLATRPGDCLGPVKLLEGFPLFSVVTKQMPAADDPCIRQRAEEAIVGNLVEQAMNGRVKWVM